jgi:hypothetical protein
MCSRGSEESRSSNQKEGSVSHSGPHNHGHKYFVGRLVSQDGLFLLVPQKGHYNISRGSWYFMYTLNTEILEVHKNL